MVKHRYLPVPHLYCIIAGLIILVAFLAFVLNVNIMCVFNRRRHLLDVYFHVFIFNQVFVDLFNVLVFTPLQVLMILHWVKNEHGYIRLSDYAPFLENGQTYKNVMKSFYSIMFLSGFSSIFTFFATSIERCKAVFRPFLQRSLEPKKAWRVFIVIWVHSISLPLPICLF